MKRTIRIIGVLLFALMILALVPPAHVHAAATTEDNPIIFKVIGTVSSVGEVQYQIAVDDVYSAAGMTYQSFTVVYPAELEIDYSRLQSNIWNIFENTESNPKSVNAIIKTGNRAPGSLLNDLNSIYFTLTDMDEFPPDGSTVTITATKEKVAFFQDPNGYVHYYQFVPFSLSGGVPQGGNNPATGVNKNWWDAYNLAKNATMQDPRYPDDPTKVLKGYLATITNVDEQMQIYSAIADWSGWLGGTRMLYTDTTKIHDSYPIPTNTAGNTTGYIFGTAQNRWYWACGPEAWTVYDPATEKYTYYPEGWTTVFNDSWVIYNSLTGNNTYLCRSAVEPDVPDLGEHQTLIPDPNRGEAVGPLEFYGNNVYTQITTTTGTDYPIPGVYHNWNNPEGGIVHVFDANKNFAGTRPGGGAEPNGATNEYCLQFAYGSGTYTIPAGESATGAVVSTNKPDTWNDYAAFNTTSLYGYFIEFGGYPGDPKGEDLVGSGVSTSSEVELVMPIIIQYRSTVLTDEGRYARISEIDTLLDRVTTYAASIPYTAVRNFDARAENITGYTPYGYAFYGTPEDEARLTLKANGDVDGFHSNYTQRIQFLYKPDAYTLTFDANFPDWSSADVSPGSKTILYDSPYGELAMAKRPGYTFAGWYTDAAGTGKEIAPVDYVEDQGAQTIYAQWTEKADFTVNYDLNGGAGYSTPKEDISWTDDGLLPSTNPTRVGYVFIGWDVSVNGTKQGVKATDTYGSLADSEAESSITLQAQWMEEDLITIFYHLNGAETPSAEGLSKDGVLEPESHPVDFPAATRTGYEFAGWKVTDNGLGFEGDTYAAGTTTEVYGDLAGLFEGRHASFVILEAQWTPKQYTVNYDKNDGSGSTSYGTPRTGVLWAQNGLVPPAEGNPLRTNYVFMGWNTKADGSGITAYVGTSYSQLAGSDGVGAITLYAQWMPEKTYHVSYDTNGGSPASIADKTGVYLGSDSLIPATSPTPPTGYVFEGWRVVYNGSKAGVTSADKFGELAYDPNLGYIVLRAQYSPKGVLTVYYNLNGHTQSGYPAQNPANPPTDPYIVWTQSNLLPSADPVRSGYTFLGWNTASNGSGIAATNVDTFGVLAGGNDTLNDITLYAQWQAITADTYTVIYNSAGGSQIPNDILDSPGALVKLDPPLTWPTGYSFSHWVVEDNGYGQGTGMVSAGAKYEDLAYGSGENIKLFIKLKAVYTERDNYKVIYDSNYSGGATHTETGVSWTQSGFVPYSASRPGFSLVGWKAIVGGAEINVLESTQYRTLAGGDDSVESVTLLAQWETAAFLVRYDLNGVGVPADSMGAFNQRIVGLDDTGLVPVYDLKRVGYALTGWNVSENGSKLNVSSTDSYKTLANTGAAYITLQAQWAPKEYTVNYDTNGGLAVTSKKVGWAADNLLPGDVPVRYGYIFNGWKLSKIESSELSPSQIAAGKYLTNADKYSELANVNGYDSGNITLQAQWTARTYSVVYDINDGIDATAVPSSIVSKTGVIWSDSGLLPAGVSPARADGYKFAGWKVSVIGAAPVSDIGAGSFVTATNTFGSLAGNANDAVSSITLQAQWNATQGYSVLYDLNGGAASPAIPDLIKSVDSTDSGFIPQGVTITKPGYTFSGNWVLVMRGTTAVSTPVAVNSSSSFSGLAGGETTITLSPVYNENANVSITFGTKTVGSAGAAQADGQGGSVTPSGTGSYPPVTGNPTSTAAANTGYSFVGWYAASDTAFTNILDRNAAFSPRKDSNGLNIDGGSYVALFREAGNVTIRYLATAGGTVSRASESLAPLSGSALGAVAAPKTGYYFAGWYLNAVKVSDDDSFIPEREADGLYKDAMYVAMFMENERVDSGYTVNHYSVDASNNIDLIDSEQLNGIIGSKVTAAAKTAYVGYTYAAGHSLEKKTGTVAAGGGLVLELYYKVATYNIKYVIQGSIPSGSPTAPPAENNIPYGATKPVAADLTSTSDYTFSGWRTSDCKVASGSFEMPNSDVTFYGSWVDHSAPPVAGYAVRHYLVDALGSSSLTETDDFSAVAGSGVTAAPKTYTGYTYAPGYTGEAKTGTVLSDGSLVLNLYYTIEKYAIRYVKDNDPAGAPAPPAGEADVARGASKTIADPGDMFLAGYVFNGWHTTDCKTDGTTFVMPDRSVIFHGSWIANPTGSDVSGYKVKHYLVDENGNATEFETNDFSGVSGTTVSASPKSYAGYTYASGYSGELKQDTLSADGDLVLKLYYAVDEYNISYVTDNNPAGAPAPPLGENGVARGAAKTMADPDDMYLSGYIFNGWYTADCKVSGRDFEMPDRHVTFRGDWIMDDNVTADTYTIRHHLVGAAGPPLLHETEVITGAVGATAAALPKNYTGYTYDHILSTASLSPGLAIEPMAGYTGDVQTGTIATGGTLVFDLYYTASTHKVTYVVSGTAPPGGPSAPAAVNAAYGEALPVASDLFFAGSTFSLWRSADVKIISGRFIMPDNDVTFYGTWTTNPLVGSKTKKTNPVVTNPVPTPAPVSGAGQGSSLQEQLQDEPTDWGFLEDEDNEEEQPENETMEDELSLEDPSDGAGSDDGDQSSSGTTGSEMTFNRPMTPEEVLTALKDDGVPIFNVGSNETPLFSKPGLPAWSQINLILASIGITLGISLIISMIKSRKRGIAPVSGKKGRMMKLLIALGVLGIVIFLITQDTRNLVVFIDGWTAVHAAILFVEIFILRSIMKKPEGANKDVDDYLRRVV